jgi:hypothetical protein
VYHKTTSHRCRFVRNINRMQNQIFQETVNCIVLNKFLLQLKLVKCVTGFCSKKQQLVCFTQVIGKK